MPLIDLNATPSASMRRWFGFSLVMLLVLLAFLVSPFGEPFNLALLSSAGAMGAIYYAWRESQLVIIRGWQLLTFPVAWIVGHSLLGLVFFGIVLPIGLVLRARGYDPLRLRKSGRSSNWQDRSVSPPAERYFKQF